MVPSRGPRGVDGRGGRQTPSSPAARRVSRASGRRSVVVLAQQQRAEAPSRRQQLAGLAALAAALAARPAQAGLFDGGKAERERYEKDTVRPGEPLPRTLACVPSWMAPLALLGRTAAAPAARRVRPWHRAGLPLPACRHQPARLTACALTTLLFSPPCSPRQATVITNVRNAATLERDAPGREETMEAVRKEINGWVARYRR